jgi:molybdenum cofactor biosynthesis protein B
LAHDAHHRSDVAATRVAILTVSDTRTAETDTSGKAAQELVARSGHRVVDYRIVPDEPERVREIVCHWLGQADLDVIIVNGGTGVSARDRTFEALETLLDKKLDGFAELFRALSFEEIGARAMLSRALGGVARSKAIFSVPGSTAAVRLALERLILPEIGHLIAELRKGA